MSSDIVSIGIDLGGTSMRVGIFDSAMHPLATRSIITRVSAGPQSCVEEMAATINALLGNLLPRRHVEVTGVGIGSPGPIDLRAGVLGFLPNLPGWENFPLRDALEQAVGLPVILESDANAAAVGEWKYGAGHSHDMDSLAMIALGTGVGSGLILNGKVWHGMFGMAGEIGHATIDPDGPLCSCGSRGCLECFTSASGIVRLARTVAETTQATPSLCALFSGEAEPETSQIARLAEEGDAAARLVFDQMGHYLGIGVANLINTLDLEMIIIGGGVAGAWSLFAPAMFQALRAYSVVYRLLAPSQNSTRERDRTFICPAGLGASAGLLGAAALPLMNEDDSKRELSSVSS